MEPEYNYMRRLQSIGSDLLLSAQRGENLDKILSLARDSEATKRTLAVAALARFPGRESFIPLLKLSSDSDLTVASDAVIGLGVSKDSRAYFFLSNLFLEADQIFDDIKKIYNMRKSIIFAFRENRDQRGRELLKVALESNVGDLAVIAKQTLKLLDHNTKPFIYTFVDSNKEIEEAREKQGLQIQNYEDLLKIEEILERQERATSPSERVQTYIVNTEGTFVLGGELREHVQVASGKDVLGGGEAYLEKHNGKWDIVYLNNRSNGYYPHESSFEIVDKALRKTSINYPSAFNETFPREGWLDQDVLFVRGYEITKLLRK